MYLSRTAQGRPARRHKVFYPVELTIADRPVRAHVLDLSATGALLHCAAPPAMASVLTLIISGERRLARVMKVRGRKFGVAFADPFDNDQLLALIDRVDAEQHAAAMQMLQRD